MKGVGHVAGVGPSVCDVGLNKLGGKAVISLACLLEV